MKKKKIAKLREFWNHNINPITGWKVAVRSKSSKGVPEHFKRTADQASQFKPRGF